MRLWAFAILVLFGSAFLGASTAHSGGKAGGPIKIEYHGQSFYILTTSKGTRVAFDPHTIPAYHPDGIVNQHPADIVCMSHNHPDHTRMEAIKIEKGKKPTILRGLKTPGNRADWNIFQKTIGELKFKTVGVYHDDSEGLARGKVAVFVVEVDGWRIAHLGDLGHLLTPSQLKRIGPVDVVMIPVGGIYTLNGAEAKKVVAQLKPKEYVFPMHFGTKVFEDVLPVDEFYEDVEKRRIAVLDENVIKLNRDPQRPRPLIVQLHYWAKEKKEK
ncbi:MAG: MBL fold metallo-hydrolase [Planctomycetes bacterium]|jgi:L-ascorbate metabolism protein UlaG (beta-lactamase superfamily)|nr:MBL fold metallo-hydrolase [Planctomycetota bacterium]